MTSQSLIDIEQLQRDTFGLQCEEGGHLPGIEKDRCRERERERVREREKERESEGERERK